MSSSTFPFVFSILLRLSLFLHTLGFHKLFTITTRRHREHLRSIISFIKKMLVNDIDYDIFYDSDSDHGLGPWSVRLIMSVGLGPRTRSDLLPRTRSAQYNRRLRNLPLMSNSVRSPRCLVGAFDVGLGPDSLSLVPVRRQTQSDRTQFTTIKQPLKAALLAPASFYFMQSSFTAYVHRLALTRGRLTNTWKHMLYPLSFCMQRMLYNSCSLLISFEVSSVPISLLSLFSSAFGKLSAALFFFCFVLSGRFLSVADSCGLHLHISISLPVSQSSSRTSKLNLSSLRFLEKQLPLL
ncbi:hypothetical protein LXL04_009032 [Taraxacum kok-saghyz]